MRVDSTIRINEQRIQQLSKAASTALELTAEALHNEVVQAQVVPRRDGVLQGESFFVDTSESKNGSVMLVHAVPYARRLYYHPEYKFHRAPWAEEWVDKKGRRHRLTHDGNPHAQAHWFDDWLPGGSKAEDVQEAFKIIYKKVGGV